MSFPAQTEQKARTVSVEEGSSYWATVCALAATDMFAITTVVSVLAWWFMAAGASVSYGTIYGLSASITLFLTCAYAAFGLYRVIDIHPAEELRQMSVMTVIAGAAATLVGAVYVPESLAVFLGGTLLMAIVVPTCRVLGRILLARTDWWGVPVVVLGTGSHGRAVVTTLNRWPELGFRPVALLQDRRLEKHEGVPSPTEPDRAPTVARMHHVPYAIIAMPNMAYEERARMITHFGKFFQRLFVVPEGLGPAALWTARSSSQGLLGFGVKHIRLSVAARTVKRCIDVVGAVCGLIVLTPLFATIAGLIKLDSHGPVFFKQQRMGMEGRCFTVLKFRTMYTDAEARLEEILDEDSQLRAQYEKYHKLQNDPRATRIGKWLRRLSLDELPQLWNVLRGDMSLVGPRAYMPGELPKMNGLSRSVLQCPPGLTGLWQVSGRNNLDFRTRVDLDVHYMQNWTLWLDLYILIRTIPVVLSGHGAN
jgi:Undecaprenyl-phosphate galactose phosphotransferase WbaP